MATYSDVVKLLVEDRMLAWRNDSLEINESRAHVVGARVCIDGCWGIASRQGWSTNIEELKRLAWKAARSSSTCPGLAEAEIFRGKVELGFRGLDIEGLFDLLPTLCSEAREVGVENCEVIVVKRFSERIIEHEQGEARESKTWIEVEVGLSDSRGGFGSWRSYVVAWTSLNVARIVEEVFRTAMEVYRASLQAKPLHPLSIGKATLVLDHECSAALAHEVSHLLTAPSGTALLGTQLASSELTMFDDPMYPGAASYRVFDDECVRCVRRTLVENGRVIDLHHIRETAHKAGSIPGSAHGLFAKPIPFHTTLIVKSGDWREEEIVEETRRGFMVRGCAMATLESGYVRIVPMIARVIERGEARDFVKLREVRIPLKALRSIDALSRDAKARHGYEKQWIVTEIAPSMRLIAYVQ